MYDLFEILHGSVSFQGEKNKSSFPWAIFKTQLIYALPTFIVQI